MRIIYLLLFTLFLATPYSHAIEAAIRGNELRIDGFEPIILEELEEVLVNSIILKDEGGKVTDLQIDSISNLNSSGQEISRSQSYPYREDRFFTNLTSFAHGGKAEDYILTLDIESAEGSKTLFCPVIAYDSRNARMYAKKYSSYLLFTVCFSESRARCVAEFPRKDQSKVSKLLFGHRFTYELKATE